jgi:hypothetical protein
MFHFIYNQVFDPHYHETDSVLIVRDFPPDRSRVRIPRIVDSLEQLDARSLSHSEDSRSVYYGRRMPTERGKIFKVREVTGSDEHVPEKLTRSLRRHIVGSGQLHDHT